MGLGRLFGVHIVLNGAFLGLLAVLGLVGLLAEALVVFSVVFIHEMAHVAAAKAAGLSVSEVELLPFGGVARIDDLLELNPAVEALVAIAGPMSNLALIGVAFAEGYLGIVPPHWNELFWRTNAVIGVFNLWPAIPLDGGRMFRAFLSSRIGFRRAADAAVKLSKASALALSAAGAVLFHLKVANASLMVVAAFLYVAAGKEQRLAAYVFLRYLARKRLALKERRCLPSIHLAAHPQTPIKEALGRLVPRAHHLVWVTDQRGRVVGLAAEIDLIDAMFEKGMETPMEAVARPLFERAAERLEGAVHEGNER